MVATLIPKLRVHFAEFLNEGSPAHLRILSPHTCVGLRYGRCSSHQKLFSTVWGQRLREYFYSLRVTPQPQPCGFAYMTAYTLAQELPISCSPTLLCHSIAQTIHTGTGISTSCPSPTLSASDQVPTYPGTTIVAQESLCFRWEGFSPSFSLLIPTFSLPISPPCLTAQLLPYGNAPLPHMPKHVATASVPYFSPGNLRRRVSRPVSYYALFKWWLLLSQHPGCL